MLIKISISALCTVSLSLLWCLQFSRTYAYWTIRWQTNSRWGDWKRETWRRETGQRGTI